MNQTIFTTLIVAFLMSSTSCNLVDDKATKVHIYLDQQVTSQSNGVLKLDNFEKTNGIEQNFMGVNFYVIEWEADISTQQEIWHKGDELINARWDNFMVTNKPSSVPFARMQQHFFPGGRIHLRGTSNLQKTENGWRVEDINVVGSQILNEGSRPELPADLIRRLDGSTLNSEFFGNQVIKERLLMLLDKDRYDFMERNWSIGTPAKLDNDILVKTGCMSHFCPQTNFIVIIDISQNTFHAGIRDSDKVEIYSEDENKQTQWVKLRMQHWIEYGSD